MQRYKCAQSGRITGARTRTRTGAGTFCWLIVRLALLLRPAQTACVAEGLRTQWSLRKRQCTTQDKVDKDTYLSPLRRVSPPACYANVLLASVRLFLRVL